MSGGLDLDLMNLSIRQHVADKQAEEWQPVCGGIRFKRKFDKRSFPLLGDKEDDDEPLIRTRSHVAMAGPRLSVPVATVYRMFLNEKGRWHWPANGADLVYPGIFLGDAATAICIRVLKDLGITAVLNAAQGDMDNWSYVNTKEHYYAGTGIEFMGVPAIDLKHYPMHRHFHEAADFIEKVVKSGGVVLVHCVQGISRSATLILAYLIIKKKIKIAEAISIIKSKRSCGPNEGFCQQLIELNDQVHGLKT